MTPASHLSGRLILVRPHPGEHDNRRLVAIVGPHEHRICYSRF